MLNDLQNNRSETDHDPYVYDMVESPCHESHFGSNMCLAIFRAVCLLWFTVEWVVIAASSNSFANFMESFKFLTQESLFLTWFYFLIVVIDVWTGKRLQKFVLVLNFTILVTETLVFLFFWTVLLPDVVKNWDSFSPLLHWGMISWHLTPFVTLVIDFLINMHIYEVRHWWAPVGYLLLYAV